MAVEATEKADGAKRLLCSLGDALQGLQGFDACSITQGGATIPGHHSPGEAQIQQEESGNKNRRNDPTELPYGPQHACQPHNDPGLARTQVPSSSRLRLFADMHAQMNASAHTVYPTQTYACFRMLMQIHTHSYVNTDLIFGLIVQKHLANAAASARTHGTGRSESLAALARMKDIQRGAVDGTGPHSCPRSLLIWHASGPCRPRSSTRERPKT